MIIEKEIVFKKNINDAWQVLGVQFADAYKWASAVNHSEGFGENFEGATCSERGCATSIGKLNEKLLTYSPQNYSLSYELVEGMPSMVRCATNSWQLTSLNPESTKLSIRMDFTLGGFVGSLMQPLMKMQMSKMGNELVEDFAYYVENGKPHPRKLKAIEKFRKS